MVCDPQRAAVGHREWWLAAMDFEGRVAPERRARQSVLELLSFDAELLDFEAGG